MWLPALSVPRATPVSDATPLPSVAALPAPLPSMVKEMVLPLTGLPDEVSVADRLVVPPYVPLADATLSAVGSVSM